MGSKAILLIAVPYVFSIVYPRPETFPVLIPIDLSRVEDSRNLFLAARADSSLLISVYSIRRYFDGIFPLNLLPYNYPYVSENTA